MKTKACTVLADEKNYAVVGINGFRRGSLTESEALRLARDMQKQMQTAGWAGKLRVFYRDGSEVDLTKEGSR